MKKFLIFLLLLLPLFFLPNRVEAGTGKCICKPGYRTESERTGSGNCQDTRSHVCETACSETENCTSWRKTINRWEVCETDEEGEEHCHCESERTCSISYNREYKCTENCDGRLQERIHETGCGAGYTSWVDTREGFEWQKCDPDVPGFFCSGECIEAPQNLQEYQTPDSSVPADSPVKLPVKLDWDDVPGFWAGWSGGGGGSAIQKYAECQRGYIDFCWEEAKALNPGWRCQGEITDEYLVCLRRETKENCQNLLEEEECEEKCPPEKECYKPEEFVQSYKITITGDLRSCDDGSDKNSDTFVLGTSEFFAPCPCFFKSNREYTWKVQACCTTDGSNCGPWSVSNSFSTSLAPEPILPADPDWAGPDRAEPNWNTPTVENPYPVHLEWCPVDEAKSYCLRMYKAGTPFIRMYGQGEPFCPVLFSELFCPAIVPPKKDFPIQSYFDFGLDVFTKETDYQWKIATCLNQEGQKCGLSCPEDKICYTFETLKSECGCCDFSQLWNFFGRVTLPVPELISPKDGEFVNFTDNLQWAHVPGANSYRYEIKRNSSVIINEAIVEEYIPIRDLWSKGILAFNTKYTWHIQPCWDQKGQDCQEGAWSAEWSFSVSGAPPTGLQADASIIPVKLSWENASGALSYYYEVARDSSFNNIVIPETQRVLKGDTSEILVDYPYLVQDTDYWWRVKTCIDEKGEVCGNWSNTENFKTFKLGKPTEPYPSDGSEFYTYERYLKWKEVPGARAYQYEVYEGIKTIPLTKVPTNSAYVDTPRELGVGEHAWHVKACLDENCQETGEFSDVWHFNVVEAKPPGGEAGLVPCGRDVNFPDPYGIDETERCGFQHIFLLLRNILDLALWRIGLIILVLLVLASGIIFYFSGQLGMPEPIFQVKSLWKAAGIGYSIIFSAYTLVNIFLAIFGYKIGVFGPWWVISF
jgi:hypothetical protein